MALSKTFVWLQSQAEVFFSEERTRHFMPDSSKSRPCPACVACDARIWGRKNGFSLLRCSQCQTVFTDHLPADEEEHSYENYYRPDNFKKPDFLNRRLDEIMAGMAPFRQSGRLLDIGCGGGEWLHAARRAGWQAQGLEVGAPVVEYLREQGFEVFHGFLEEAKYPDEQFDVVLAIEVLEHVPDAGAILREIARVLRPGGVLWATTPHGSGISARLLREKWSVVAPPEHLQLFGKRGMHHMLRAAGFSQTRVQTQGTNPFELVRALRKPRAATGAGQSASFNRGQSSYQLNEFLTEKPSRRLIKNALNGALSATRLGDSLKIRAVK